MTTTRSQKATARPGQVRNILAGQIAKALQLLSKPTRISDEAVHDARKTLKRARASLRLMRDAIGNASYARENTALRNAARPLTPMRDAKVMHDTAKGLFEEQKDKASRDTLLRLQHEFLAERRDRQTELMQDAYGLQTVLTSLKQAGQRARRLRIRDARAPRPYAGLKRIYRTGRKAMRNANVNRSDEKLHEARKQAKYLAAAMATLGFVGARNKQAESVADSLGADHDLALLRPKIGAADKTLTTHLKRHRAQLQKQALKEARRLYRKNPGPFVRSLVKSLPG